MRIITISHEYGSGGHAISHAIAERLGIPYYDRELINKTAEASGLNAKVIEEEEEKRAFGSGLFASYSTVYYDFKDTIFDFQCRVIRQAAEKGPCVILGRCSDYILSDTGLDLVRVFLFADEESRLRHVNEREGRELTPKQLKKIDNDRHAYYTHYTGNKWGSKENHDLLLNTAVLGYETCVRLICEAARFTEPPRSQVKPPSKI